MKYLLIALALTLPTLPIKKKRLVAPRTHGSTQLISKPAAVVQPTNIYTLTFRYSAGYTNGQTNLLTWDLMSTTNLKDWIVEQWHVEGKTNLYVTNAGERIKLFKVRGY